MSQHRKKTPIINCHTHIFTINNVPNEFGKTFLPWPLYKIFTINFVKWYYLNLTPEGNKNLANTFFRLKRFFEKVKRILRYIFPIWWLFLLVSTIFRWVKNIFLNFFRLDFLFSEETKELYYRYMTMARYAAKYKSQGSIYGFLKMNYAPNTKFIVLPMDMDYMGAGKAQETYLSQVEKLMKVKKNHPETIFPFLFLDPRRRREDEEVKDEADKYSTFFYSNLKNGFFSGIKMYPALGYYPFDKTLIPFLEFATKYEIPIMTHCIRGTVYFRACY